MTNHAMLGPSSAHRWLNCPPSAKICYVQEDKISEAALEGTAAHSMAEVKLNKYLGIESIREITKYDNAEMEEYTDEYASYVIERFEELKKKDPNAILKIEYQVDFSSYVCEGFGTADTLIITKDEIHIVDLKYGTGIVVEANDNPQMKLYALGAIESIGNLMDINKIHMTIYQPRRNNISTFSITPDELYKWATEIVKPTAALAIEGNGEFKPGPWCQFCKGAVLCKARGDEMLKLAEYEFKDERFLKDSDIAKILEIGPQLVTWVNEIKDYALSAALNQGVKWPGYKLVEGKSNRKYMDETKIIEALSNSGFKDIYKKSLKTITEMEKMLGKDKFNEIIGSYVDKPKGKPTLVPIDDKRQEILSVKGDFINE